MKNISLFGKKRSRQKSKGVKALKIGKSAGVVNIPAELVQAGGKAMLDVLTLIFNTILKTGEWSSTWTQSLFITLPKRKLVAVTKLQNHQPYQSLL